MKLLSVGKVQSHYAQNHTNFEKAFIQRTQLLIMGFSPYPRSFIQFHFLLIYNAQILFRSLIWLEHSLSLEGTCSFLKQVHNASSEEDHQAQIPGLLHTL